MGKNVIYVSDLNRGMIVAARQGGQTADLLDFYAQRSLEFAENHAVGSSSTDRNTLLMKEVR